MKTSLHFTEALFHAQFQMEKPCKNRKLYKRCIYFILAARRTN